MFEKFLYHIPTKRLCFTMLMAWLCTISLWADDASLRNIRVGFYALRGYHNIDESGVKSGYGYDFLSLMKRYSNVSFEYIGYNQSRLEQMQMLQNGRIDLLTGIHKTEELEAEYDFSVPIGLNSVQLRVREDDPRFDPDIDNNLNGIVIGFSKNSLLENRIKRYAQEKGFTYIPKYFESFDSVNEALIRGEIDASATTSLRKSENEIALIDFDAEHFYAIVRKGDTELLKIVNNAIRQMNASEGDWKSRLNYNNYYQYKANNDLHFTPEEKAFIAAHKTGGEKIIIAYDNKWAPFTYKEQGKYVGILPEYWNLIAEMTGMEFEEYGSGYDIINEQDVLDGKADIYLGYCFDASTSETNGFVESSTIMEVGACNLIIKGTTKIRKVGISRINPRLNSMLKLEEGQKAVLFSNAQEALKALKKGEVDQLFLYDYEGQMMVNRDNSGTLQHLLVPNISMSLCAISPDTKSHMLISIVSKCVNAITASEVNTIAARNLSVGTSEMTLMNYIRLNPFFSALIAAFILILIWITFFVFMRNRMERQHKKELETRIGIIQSMNNIYFSSHYIDLKKDTYIKLTCIDAIQEVADRTTGAQATLFAACDNLILPEYQPSLHEFLDLSTINERLKDHKILSAKFRTAHIGWCQAYIIEGDRDKEGELQHVFYAVREYNYEQHKEDEYIRQLEQAKNEAEAANMAKTSFLFNMSHDIRTPMNAIMGFRNLLESNQEDPEKRADYLHKIEASSNVLLSIINNVLEMARIEKGTVEIEDTPWSTEQFNDTLFSVFDVMMKEKGLNFIREVKVQHQQVFCDPTKLREIFINILSNACKYTEAGGTVKMVLEEIPCPRAGWVTYRTTVTDTGMGMSEEFLPHIFEEFTREKNTTMSKIEGTGLGMPIVKRLVEMLGGTIDVQSQVGVGTTVTVTLTHRLAQPTQLSDHAEVKCTPTQFKGKRLLLAEDNDLNAEIATAILEEEGFIIDHAEDGQICCDMLQKAPDNYYDAILMDIQMPNMNGYEATKTIRSMNNPAKAHIPIIAMTANAFEEDKREAIRVGMNEHLAKPINVTELMKILSKILSA